MEHFLVKAAFLHRRDPILRPIFSVPFEYRSMGRIPPRRDWSRSTSIVTRGIVLIKVIEFLNNIEIVVSKIMIINYNNFENFYI